MIRIHLLTKPYRRFISANRSDYEAQLKERLTVFLMAKYLVDDFNQLEAQSFVATDATGKTRAQLGFDELLTKISQLNQY